MPLIPYEETLSQASEAAGRGDWPTAIAILQQFSEIQPGHTGALSALGTCLIQAGRPAEAIPYFTQVAASHPASAEAHNNLGVAYFSAGQLPQAVGSYESAIALSPDHGQARKNLAVACLQLGKLAEGVGLLAALVRENPQDVESLTLLAHCYAEAEDYASARTLYEQALKTSPENETIQTALAALPQESGQRSAVSGQQTAAAPNRIARPEHAEKLLSLRRSAVGGQPSAASRQPLSVLLCLSSEAADAPRGLLAARALAQNGWRVKTAVIPAAVTPNDADVFIFFHPQPAPQWLETAQVCKQAGKRVMVDLNTDFHRLPASHPAYTRYGPGNPASLRALEEGIRLADGLIVATGLLAERYGKFAHRVEVIANGWDPDNPFWYKPVPPRSAIHLGWAGNSASREDLEPFRQGVIRILREYPQTRLLVSGDPAALALFGSISEKRRQFLPAVANEDFPYVLAQFDIRLVSRQENDYNGAESDAALVEAGARAIPWVASALPAYREWAAGGLLAEKPADWYPALKRLVENAALRAGLGASGRAKAEARAAEVVQQWQPAVNSLFQSNVR